MQILIVYLKMRRDRFILHPWQYFKAQNSKKIEFFLQILLNPQYEPLIKILGKKLGRRCLAHPLLAKMGENVIKTHEGGKQAKNEGNG